MELRPIAEWRPGVQLRDYQELATSAALTAAQDHSLRSIITLPTGTGKSLCIAKLAHTARAGFPHQQVLVLHASSELIKQNEATFRTLFKSPFKTGIVSAKLKRKDWAEPVVFASINSVYDHPRRFRQVSAIIIDECHLVSARGSTMFYSFLTEVWKLNQFCRLFGFSATPYRLGLGPLEQGGVFNHVAFDGCSPAWWAWFLEQGWLSRPVPKQTKTEMDLTGLKTTAGDFQLKQMDDRFSQDLAATAAAVAEAAVLARDRRKWLVFCTGVNHVEATTKLINSHGRRAVAVHSKLDPDEQATRIKAFREGKVDVLVNMNMLTTGFDVADVDCIVMLRPTKSVSLWVQMLGRGTRPCFAPGYPVATAEQRLAAILASVKQNCLVLDFARNTERLGPVDDPNVPKGVTKRKGGLVPQKVCEHIGSAGTPCLTYNAIAATHCIGCGEPFPTATKLREEASTLALISGGKDQVVAPPPKVERWVERIRPGALPVAQLVEDKLRGGQQLRVIYPTVKANRACYLRFDERWQARLWTALTHTTATSPEEAAEAFRSTAMPLAVLMKRSKKGSIHVEQTFFDEISMRSAEQEYGSK